MDMNSLVDTNFATNYGYNFDVFSVSLYYLFSNPIKDNITVISPNNVLVKLISFDIARMNPSQTDTLILKGYQDDILIDSSAIYVDTIWQTKTFNWDNINKLVITLFSPIINGPKDFNFDNFIFQEELVPVQLTSFTGIESQGNIMLSWQTSTETNNYGFDIERNNSKIGFISGSGNSNSIKKYSYIDKNFPTGNLDYRLKIINTDGSFTYSNLVSLNVVFKNELEQNYPNPFSSESNIEFTTNSSGFVRLVVYNILGQKIKILLNKYLSSGRYSIKINSANFPSGLYLYELRINGFESIKKMVIIK